ncbi:hypothetical protein [Pectobacterium sp. B1J-3]|uniref:hypothetical protein n=1 Tax=Pectobacterium sp. B1J-3 TaxID=3385371 RepID=UPI003905C412
MDNKMYDKPNDQARKRLAHRVPNHEIFAARNYPASLTLISTANRYYLSIFQDTEQSIRVLPHRVIGRTQNISPLQTNSTFTFFVIQVTKKLT